MPSAAELGDAFFSGSLFGRTPSATDAFTGTSRMMINKSNPGGGNSFGGRSNVAFGAQRTPEVFDQTAFDAATKAGYSSKDINRFLQDSGIKASGSMFQVGGMGSYSGKNDVYWQVTPGFKAPASAPPPAAASTIAPTPNVVEQTITLPNNGLGTIESIQAPPPAVSAPAPILGDPLGDGSQRVSRQKARLSIAS